MMPLQMMQRGFFPQPGMGGQGGGQMMQVAFSQQAARPPACMGPPSSPVPCGGAGGPGPCVRHSNSLNSSQQLPGPDGGPQQMGPQAMQAFMMVPVEQMGNDPH